MAQQIAVIVTCDICGGTKDTQTRSISLDEKVLEIDLCAKDGRGLDKVAAKFVPHARKVTRRAVATGRRTITDRHHSASLREWAKGQGLKIGDRGRIPENVEQEFEAAH
jgi:hypothetical protein